MIDAFSLHQLELSLLPLDTVKLQWLKDDGQSTNYVVLKTHSQLYILVSVSFNEAGPGCTPVCH